MDIPGTISENKTTVWLTGGIMAAFVNLAAQIAQDDFNYTLSSDDKTRLASALVFLATTVAGLISHHLHKAKDQKTIVKLEQANNALGTQNNQLKGKTP